MNRSTKAGLAVVTAATIFVAGSATGAIADKLITGDDIARNAVSSRHLASESVGAHKLKPGLREAIRDARTSGGSAGEAGVAGPAGATGPAGPAGQAGAPGKDGKDGDSVVSARAAITDGSVPGATDDFGAFLVPIIASESDDSERLILSLDLDEGTYVVDVIAQFFGGSESFIDYGVVTMDQDGANIPGTVWTADLPGTTDNAGQANGSHLITVPAGGSTIEVRASIRGTRDGMAAAQAIVTRVNPMSTR